MVEDLNTVEPPEQQGPGKLADVRRQQFRQANASLVLEGMRPDSRDQALQERVALGALTPDDAVAEYVKHATAGTL